MEDVFPIELGDISASYVSLPEGIPFEGSWVPMMESSSIRWDM